MKIEFKKGKKVENNHIILVNGEQITMYDLLYLVKIFHDNEIKIIEMGEKFPNGTPYPDWFGMALKLIADTNLSFEEICKYCHIPKKVELEGKK